MFLTLSLFLLKTFIRFSLFLFVIWPLEPTSKGSSSTFHPTFSRSTFKSLYFLAFLKWALSIFFSKLHVNSSNSIFFSFLLIRTRSGRNEVVRISGGIVPPFNQRVGRSARISMSFDDVFLSEVVRW